MAAPLTPKRILAHIGIAMVGLLLLRAMWVLGHVAMWREGPIPTSTSFMDDRLDVMREKNPKATLAFRPVAYAQISTSLKRAVLAAEDAGFRHHHGFDIEGLTTAWKKNWKAGRVVMGGSTITQQLAKNLFLTPQRSVVRKAEEALITLAIELLWSKRRILEVYLNVIEWGDGVFGADAAARHYFGTSAASLSADQAAKLAAMIPRPRYFDRHRQNPRMLEKAARVRRTMDALAVP